MPAWAVPVKSPDMRVQIPRFRAVGSDFDLEPEQAVLAEPRAREQLVEQTRATEVLFRSFLAAEPWLFATLRAAHAGTRTFTSLVG
jgi:hypothetical protein